MVVFLDRDSFVFWDVMFLSRLMQLVNCFRYYPQKHVATVRANDQEQTANIRPPWQIAQESMKPAIRTAIGASLKPLKDFQVVTPPRALCQIPVVAYVEPASFSIKGTMIS